MNKKLLEIIFILYLGWMFFGGIAAWFVGPWLVWVVGASGVAGGIGCCAWIAYAVFTRKVKVSWRI